MLGNDGSVTRFSVCSDSAEYKITTGRNQKKNNGNLNQFDLILLGAHKIPRQ